MDSYLEKMKQDGAILGSHPHCNAHDDDFLDEEDFFEAAEPPADVRTPAQYAEEEAQYELSVGKITTDQLALRRAQLEGARAFNVDGVWLHSDGQKRVADPYWAAVEIPPSSPSGRMLAFDLTFAAVSLVITLGTLFMGIPTFGAASWLYIAWNTYFRRKNKRANNARAELLAEKHSHQTYLASGNAYWQLKVISDGIAASNDEQRAELRPLWDAALEAASVLDKEDSAVAIAALNARAYAVQDFRRVEDEIEAAERAAALSTREHAIEASPDSSDLAAIRVLTESRRAGVEAYRSMAGE